MVIIREDKNLITMTRGDTLIINIDIVDEDGNKYEPDIDNDKLRFALKASYSDEDPLLVKDIPIDTCQLRIEGWETRQLIQPGEYVYDVQLMYGDNIISTIIPNKNAKVARIKILEEVL